MRTYELVLVVKSALSEANRKKLLETMYSWLKDVKVTQDSDWGSKALKYTIKNELTGHYFDFLLETSTRIPSDFEKKLLNEENVLRHLLIRTK